MKWVYLLLLCFNSSLGCRNYPSEGGKYFSENGWGGWTPKDNSWKTWVEKWGKENSSVAFDSTEVGRDVESGWPRFWKGMGKGNPGVPPPPWAYVEKNYGRASICYLQADPGTLKPNPYLIGSDKPVYRWGFNPSKNECQRFLYNGHDGNENNFRSKKTCVEACGRVPESGCYTGKVNFRDYIETKIPKLYRLY